VRRYVLLALKISVSLALLVLLFSRIDVGALWATARGASVAWLAAALAMYAVNVLVSAWRWHRLLRTQHIEIGRRAILARFSSHSSSVIFCEQHRRRRHPDRRYGQGGEVETLAATVVLVDRVIGLMALVLVAAVGATAPVASIRRDPDLAGLSVGRVARRGRASAPALFAPAGFGACCSL